MRYSFIFYKSFYEAIHDLDFDDQVLLYDAICRKSLYDEDSYLEGIAGTLYKLIEPQLEANNIRYENGKKGGRPNKKTDGFENEKTDGFENEKPNKHVNVNVNDIKENNIKEKVTKRFIPPSKDDVDKYIQDKGLNVDGQQFYEYFTEGGWVDAKGNKVKNWKQKLLTWNKYVITKKEEQKKKYQSYEQRTYDKNDLSRFYANNNN